MLADKQQHTNNPGADRFSIKLFLQKLNVGTNLIFLRAIIIVSLDLVK